MVACRDTALGVSCIDTRMLIDNKTNRYPDSGFNIVTVWDFINEFSGKSSEQVGNHDADVGLLENKIDFLVYKLYGLTYDEVLIVDPETPITREEYESR